MSVTELDPTLLGYELDEEKEAFKERMRGVDEAELFNEAVKWMETRKSDTAGGARDDADYLELNQPPADAAPAEVFVDRLRKRFAETDADRERAYPRLKAEGISLFGRFSDNVQWATQAEGEPPADSITVQTEDGFPIEVTRIDFRNSPLEQQPDYNLKIKYELAGVTTDITIGRAIRKNKRGGIVVASTDEAIVSFHRGETPLLTNTAMNPRHSDTLTGLLDSATPIPARKRT